MKENAAGSKQYAIGNKQYAVGSRQYAAGSRQKAEGNRQYAVGGTQYSAGNTQYAGGNLYSTVFYVVMHSCSHARNFVMVTLLTFLISISYTLAQTNPVYVDDKGILRWTNNNAEASFFGVNYASPFAYSYRALNKLGIPVKEAIDIDVAHLLRLELNAYRIHVWDREVSDKEGNLMDNEHLDLFDYLIHKLKEKGIYVILTPIAWWGTGWPEPDLNTSGFSTFYSKVEMITNPEARKAQVNYLKQFLNHVNKYDNIKYKDDPGIIAFEIINEPHHPKDTSLTASYINEMYSVFRSEGITKPVYYNISENWNKEQAAVVYNSPVQGISFQWYPTGLVKQSELTGNYLSHVDHYTIPETDSKNFKTKTRMVYEFDAADIGKSYMYPAMARSFREAGMQWASMFCYDPMFLACNNTEYQTHFLNLIYAPQKALGLMIAANVFKEVNIYQQFPAYPDNSIFGDFRISYEDNLAEMNSDSKFYYTNNTSSKPKNISSLEHIAGYGSSPVVQTDSKGSYFLDKISSGIWRLEVYPDAVWLKDPFGVNSLDRKVAEVYFSESKFTILLFGLTDKYYAVNITDSLHSFVQANNGTIYINPGVYILSENKISDQSGINFNYNGIGLKDFYTPKVEDKPTYVKNNTPVSVFEGSTANVDLEIYTQQNIKDVQLYIKGKGWGRFNQSAFIKKNKHDYSADIPAQLIKNGILEYCITVLTDTDTLTYPSMVHANPNQWDFDPSSLWKVKILPAGNPIVLFDPQVNSSNIILPGLWDKVEYSLNTVFDNDNSSFLELKLNKIKQPLSDFTFQVELDDVFKDIDSISLEDYTYFRINIDGENGKIDTVYFRYITENYNSESVVLNLPANNKLVSLNDFNKDKFVLLPRPYPQFLPYYYTSKTGIKSKSDKINFLQFTIPMESFNELKNGSRVRIGKIELVKNTQKKRNE